jgi:hypothetical protein
VFCPVGRHSHSTMSGITASGMKMSRLTYKRPNMARGGAAKPGDDRRPFCQKCLKYGKWTYEAHDCKKVSDVMPLSLDTHACGGPVGHDGGGNPTGGMCIRHHVDHFALNACPQSRMKLGLGCAMRTCVYVCVCARACENEPIGTKECEAWP